MVFRAAAEETARIEQERPECFPPLSPTGEERLRYVGHKPYDEEHLPLTDAFVQAIRATGRSSWWGCHGVRPPRILAETLAEAAARGVEVRLISNSKASSRSLMGRRLLGWMYWECGNHFRWLTERGIRMHLWERPGAFHSKNFLVDDEVCAVGSYNTANGSAFHHTESAIFAYDGELPAQVRRQFEIRLRRLSRAHPRGDTASVGGPLPPRPARAQPARGPVALAVGRSPRTSMRGGSSGSMESRPIGDVGKTGRFAHVAIVSSLPQARVPTAALARKQHSSSLGDDGRLLIHAGHVATFPLGAQLVGGR